MICLLREWSARPACLVCRPRRPSCPLSPASLAWKGQKGSVVSAALLEETAKGEQASGDAPRAEAACAPENASFSDDLEAFASDYGLTRYEKTEVYSKQELIDLIDRY